MDDRLTEYQEGILKKVLFGRCRLEIIRQKNGDYKHYLSNNRDVFEVIRSDTSKAIRSYFASRIKIKH